MSKFYVNKVHLLLTKNFVLIKNNANKLNKLKQFYIEIYRQQSQ